MLRLLLEAQTVQNLSLKEVSEEEVVVLVAGLGDSTWPSRAEGVDEDGGGSAGGGGGGGGWGVIVRPCKRASRGSVDMVKGGWTKGLPVHSEPQDKLLSTAQHRQRLATNLTAVKHLLIQQFRFLIAYLETCPQSMARTAPIC